MRGRPISTLPPVRLRNQVGTSRKLGRPSPRPSRLTEAEARRWYLLENDANRVAWRDRPHVGLMLAGACRVCYGWVDDPRHTTVAGPVG